MAVSLSQINAVVTKTLNWLRDRMVPTGTIICGLYTAPPAGYLAFKRTDRILKTQYPALCTILFKINGFKGDGSTYANIPDVDHRVIEMCSNVSEVGQLMEAALPNIIGLIDGSDEPEHNFLGDLIVASGCFTTSGDKSKYEIGEATYNAYGCKSLELDASKGNSIYRGNQLQTKSLRGLAVVKF